MKMLHAGRIQRGGMTFTSWQFGVFVAAVFGVYYLPPLKHFQVPLLVAASVFFYGYGQPELLPLLLVAVLGTYLFLVLAFRRRALRLDDGGLWRGRRLGSFRRRRLKHRRLRGIADDPVRDATLQLVGIGGRRGTTGLLDRRVARKIQSARA